MRQSKKVNYTNAIVDSPEIIWKDGTPISKEFDDVYYSAVDGIAETKHVFLDGNNLPDAWKEKESFTIAELGFGTGLNFLTTWNLWKETTNRDQRLHYISFEKNLLSKKNLEQVHQSHPGVIASVAWQSLVDRLPLPTVGFHRVAFDNVYLTLVLGDVRDFIKQLTGNINAWYLDGFSPAKNANMWEQDIFTAMAKVSVQGTTIATYTAAGDVRRGLETVGFKMEKPQGFGTKREMLRGVLNQEQAVIPRKTNATALIIGGGLAGTSAAYALEKRGFGVTILEESEKLATKASGNIAGVMMPYLASIPDTRMRFSLAGFNYTKSLLTELELRKATGVVRLVTSKRLAKLQEIEHICSLVDSNEASEILGIKTNTNGLFFKHGGIASPSEICNNFSQRAKIVANCSIVKIKQNKNSWTVISDTGEKHSADILVLANSNQVVSFQETNWLPLEPVRGQVLHYPTNDYLSKLKSVLCYDGYILPEINGNHLIGATFEHGNFSEKLESDKQTELFTRLKNYLPDLELDETKQYPGHVSFRSSTPDRMPVVGAVPISESFLEDYQTVKYQYLNLDFADSSWLPNLYVSVGHGSQGLLSCPIAGELIASLAAGDPLPLDKELVDLLNPARFLAKEANKK